MKLKLLVTYYCALFGSILSLLNAIGCTSAPSEKSYTVALSSVQCSISLPKSHQLTETDSEARILLYPERRNPVSIEIKRVEVSHHSHLNYPNTILLNNGGTLQYITSKHHGGSGGEQYELQGELTVDNRIYIVSAHYQSELSQSADFDFYFQYLGTLIPNKH